DYGWVMGHFALSMLILLAAVVLAWRARGAALGDELPAREVSVADGRAPDGRAAQQGFGDRTLIWSLRSLAALGALTIFAGTAATAAGPQDGGSPGQKINRLNIDGRWIMYFVFHSHVSIAMAFVMALLIVCRITRRRRFDAV